MATNSKMRYKYIPPKTTLTRKSIKQFMERVIPAFEMQRVKSQFATIILCSQKDCESGFKEFNFSPANEFDEPILDHDMRWMPQDDSDYDNYVAARPTHGGRTHAEHFLLAELDKLFSANKSKNDDETPSCIILYTWITPCSSCTELIIEKLCIPRYDKIPKVVAYTTNTHQRGDNVEEARERLRKAGITVQQVPYWFRETT